LEKEHDMGLGLGIFLIVVGAILSFTDLIDNAVNTNLDTLGWILIIGGVLSLVVGLVMNGQRANTSHTAVVERRETGVPPEERI
jgi:Domain of unknown function (DUF6458)